MSKATLIATLMAVVSAFSSAAKAQAPLKKKPTAKSYQPTYIITSHIIIHDDSTNSQLDNYVIVYGSEVLTVQYAESQISTVKPGASKLEQVAPGKNLYWHTRYGSWPQEPDVSQVPHIGVPIRACEMDTKYPDSDGHPVIAIQSVSSPCMSRNGDTLHYSIAPNGGVKMYEYVNFDILEETNNLGGVATPSQIQLPPGYEDAKPIAGPFAQPSVQSAPPRRDIPAIAKAANGAIVSIVMSDKDGHAIAQGSGFLISSDGVILTNYHVIAEGISAVVKFPDGAFYVVDGVLASDKARDIAVIKAHGQDFRTLPLGNSDRVQVGEDVVAIGNPLSLESTVSNGIVSGIRTVEEEGGKYLQVTAPISPGSSGGPLFNMAGEVIGITTMYLEVGENLNFAIPINDAKRLLLAKSSKIQALPNEPEPIQAGTHAGDVPSPVISPPVQPQVEHAATAEQCEADARVWGSRPDWFIKQLPYTELQTRALEMEDCYVSGAQDEPTARKNLLFLATSNSYKVAMVFRMVLYISRRDASSQYTSEHLPSAEAPLEHPPTLKQCNADALLWTHQNQAGMANRLSGTELYARSMEMTNCVAEIHGTDFRTVAAAIAYVSTGQVYTAIMIEQLHTYLLRNNEWSQFISEDAAGVR